MKRKIKHDTVEEPIRSVRAKKTGMATATISLTPRESQLRDLLLDTVRYINNKQKKRNQELQDGTQSSEESQDSEDPKEDVKEFRKPDEPLQIRFAGGWVRDKLLGTQSHDIDIAINNMTGYRFAAQVQKYARKLRSRDKHDLPDGLKNVHRIAANPAKSKHLETATTNIFDFDLDFVNLRKEVYSGDSRNPQMEFGTAKDDAFRRDATINALFYNIHSNLVEDFTGGLADMENKLIRTPLEPFTTFTDDPLRVLRLIRFASRLDFRLGNETSLYMSDSRVKEALKVKISRERVGIEIEKMLKGNDPRRALELIDQLDLYSTIFTDPTAEDVMPSTQKWSFVYDCLEKLKSSKTPGSIYDTFVRSDEAQYYAWILAALAPWHSVPLRTQGALGKKVAPHAAMCVREGLKSDNKLAGVVAAAMENLPAITALKIAIINKEAWVKERDTVGMAIRGWDFGSSQWRLQALFSLFVEAMQLESKSNEAYETLFNGWQVFIDYLEEFDVMNASALKPLVDGKELLQGLKATSGNSKLKSGVWTKDALQICMAWQLRDRGATGEREARESAIQEVWSKRQELEIPI